MKARDSDTGGYRHILSATALIAASSVVNILFGIIRTKVFAIFLGPAGVGLFGLYSLVVELAQNLAALGVQSSGVRQIAEAVGSDDDRRIGQTGTILRRISLVLALCGALLLVLAAGLVSRVTFGDDRQAPGIALLSLAVFFRVTSAGQEALLQGLRKLRDLVRVRIWGALLSTVVSILLVYWYGEDGIVPSVIAIAVASALVSWWYSRKLNLIVPAGDGTCLRSEAVGLLRLGFAFMMSSLLTIGAAYVIRIIVLQNSGVEAAGLYQAAWTLGGLYIGFILQAMGTDFYPRLTGAAKNDTLCNKLVNEQAHVSILLAGPGVIATVTLAPFVMTVFYSADFHHAVDPVRWICMGMMLRVVAWPMGYIVLAKGAQRIFLWTEVAATLVHVGLAWILTEMFGLQGASAAFLGLYLWHSIVIYVVARRLSGFRWSPENRMLGAAYLFATGFVFCAFQLLPFWIALALGSTAIFTSSICTLRALLILYSIDWVPDALQPWLRGALLLPRSS